jgi:hypothetical protein
LTRFSVPASKRLHAIKLGLWKIAWLDAVALGHSHFLISTNMHIKEMYEILGFILYPDRERTFLHSTLQSIPHEVMIFDLARAPEFYRQTRPHLYRFFCEMNHPNIHPSVRAQ